MELIQALLKAKYPWVWRFEAINLQINFHIKKVHRDFMKERENGTKIWQRKKAAVCKAQRKKDETAGPNIWFLAARCWSTTPQALLLVPRNMLADEHLFFSDSLESKNQPFSWRIWAKFHCQNFHTEKAVSLTFFFSLILEALDKFLIWKMRSFFFLNFNVGKYKM